MTFNNLEYEYHHRQVFRGVEHRARFINATTFAREKRGKMVQRTIWMTIVKWTEKHKAPYAMLRKQRQLYG